MAASSPFFIREAWLSLRRGGVMSLTAVVIIFISLTMFGAFLLIMFNLNSMIAAVNEKMEIMVYTRMDFSRENVEVLKKQIMNVPGVSAVTFIPKEKAWESFKESFNSVELESALGENPLPDAYKAKSDTLALIPYITTSLKKIPLIEDVRYGGQTADRLRLFTNVVRWVGLGVVIIMAFATLIIVVNTIRLTVLARKEDIQIMRLVGATNSFIRWPFILEGILMGLVGALCASAALKIMYDLIALQLQKTLPFLPVSFNVLEINIIYVFVFVMGLLLGFIGAGISAAQSLKLTQN